ncbi:dihydroneopterin aldolase [Puniceibacterium sediminis]|uniref:dihydroneopterin aldolase n=1 Tax=Puniceibacterium sediminis TaxID=1608407 RepID=A0A238X9U1_9RHOB|nr:dihydroneopterin aldolase [Puniceibacterium sediminis]SNR55378.1 dihydroneopterin aldolase [Puniceibacterium sediminis]
MPNEIHLAFSHPSERSLVTAGEDPRDRISLRDHIVEVEIGAFQAERGTTQRICFNVVVEVTPFTGPLDDDVDRILSYDRVTEAIAYELAAERLNLLETLAEKVAERILMEPQALRTFVRIEKLDRGSGALGVEIVRSRRDQGAHLQEVARERPHPRVIYLSNAAIASDDLRSWMDLLQASDVPAILCVGLPESALPHADQKLAQRRIDLLAMEQNAWVLAGHDPRCKVVATRTELDWAMKNGQICVWAPSKMVLDAAHGANMPRGDAITLAAWFSGQLSARELLIIGGPPPESALIPVRVTDVLRSAV